jgi:hypothetical protein
MFLTSGRDGVVSFTPLPLNNVGHGPTAEGAGWAQRVGLDAVERASDVLTAVTMKRRCDAIQVGGTVLTIRRNVSDSKTNNSQREASRSVTDEAKKRTSFIFVVEQLSTSKHSHRRSLTFRRNALSPSSRSESKARNQQSDLSLLVLGLSFDPVYESNTYGGILPDNTASRYRI